MRVRGLRLVGKLIWLCISLLKLSQEHLLRAAATFDPVQRKSQLSLINTNFLQNILEKLNRIYLCEKRKYFLAGKQLMCED
jgi:hypothetical protein